jgi:hypothetical protein
MNTKLILGQKIIFEIPYFENTLKYHGIIVGFKNSYCIVQYNISINDKTYLKQTEISNSYKIY